MKEIDSLIFAICNYDDAKDIAIVTQKLRQS